MVTNVSIRVSGIVQGVYFRYSTKERADELGLLGTVRNLPDGSVEIVCEGEEADVRALIEWSKHGPLGARVDTMDVVPGEPGHSFEGFKIVR
jgi:acylphosphatase